MKTERRHELQQNQLAEILTDVGERAKPYAKGVLGLVLAALVIACAYLYLSKRAEAEESESWDKAWLAINSQDQEGLRKIIEVYPNKPAALWSQLVLADLELTDGVGRLFRQKSTGHDLITRALDDYKNVADHTMQPLLHEHALFGVGRAQESLNKLDKAREAYGQLTKDSPDGPYAKRAQQRLEELARDSTKVWCDWFDGTEPTPANLGTGSPFANPFDEKSTSGPSLPPLPSSLTLPDIDKPKSSSSETKPDGTTAKPDDSKTAKPDDSKAGADKAEPPKTEAGKSEEAKPGDSKPAEAPVVEPKTDAAKPDAAKSEAPKPDPAKPASGKSDSAK